MPSRHLAGAPPSPTVRCHSLPSPSRYFLAPLTACWLWGCTPQYPPPAGFVDACYGGDFKEKLDGATPKFTMQIRATPADWPKVAQRFESFGSSHGLSYFDTSVTDVSGLRMLNVHLCSPKGLWLFADKRLWENGPRDNAPDEMPIFLYVYDSSLDWAKIAHQFEQSFNDWPGDVKSEWPGGKGSGT